MGTLGWSFRPIGRGQAHIFYRGALQLIDMRAKTEVARGTCAYSPLPSDDDPPFYEDAAKNFAVLKDWAHRAAETCADDYRSRILGIYGAAAR